MTRREGANSMKQETKAPADGALRRWEGIDYYLVNPTGNITLLAITPVPVSRQPEIAAMLMRGEPTGEQAGFLSESERADIKLRMAGGEFCGNATLSAAACFCVRRGLEAGRERAVTVEASGCDTPLTVSVRRTEDGEAFRASVCMPEHRSLTRRTLRYRDRVYTLPVVDEGGILHIVAEEPLGLTDREAEEAVRLWCRELDAEALGIMELRRGAEGGIELRPLVYVPGAGTCCWESSCASGSAAVGLCLLESGWSGEALSLREPGGVLTIAAQDGQIVLGGRVEIVPPRG